MNKHTTVLIGNFGSGKSELALNFAVKTAKTQPTIMVDLDIINPYFRSSDMTEVLTKNGIDMFKPVYAGTGVEGLSLPPDIYSVFIDKHESVVFDVGGDMTGAIALGQYKRNFDTLLDLEVLFVINPRRPLSSTAQATLELIEQIVSVSRLKLTGLINNANLSNETSVDDLLSGYEVVAQVSRQTGIPVRYTTSTKSILDEFSEKSHNLSNEFVGELFPITRYMRRDWDRFTGDTK